KKIGGSRPPFKGIQEQKKYGPGSGTYYSRLMGREFKPGRWSILWTLATRQTTQPVAVLISPIN
ncbi:MAG: hypothetical protein ACKPKO_25110, partial [Candidatus Fonsibacter sp.]